MHMLSLALSPALLLSLAAEPVEPTRPAVIEHGGDPAIVETLVRGMHVWHDAGTFVVGAASEPMLRKLERLYLPVTRLAPLAADEELFIVDTDSVDPVELAHTRRLFTLGDQVLLGLEPDGCLDVHGHDVRLSCHSGHVAVPRTPTVPPRSTRWSALTGVGTTTALGTPVPSIQAIVNQVNRLNIENWVITLNSNFSRNSIVPSYIDTARDQIVTQLQSLGYSPTLQSYSASHGDNVIVEIPGQTNPNSWVVLGAHYDSISFAGTNSQAPGADDNASGSSSILECARALAGSGPFENGLRLVWFSGEEHGLLGSAANAGQSASAGEDIVAMINLDMNSYRAPGDVRDCDFATNGTSASLTAFCDATAAVYVPNWASTSGVLTAGSSDHASYTSNGFPAAFLFEDLQQYYPSIHTAQDVYPIANTDFDLSEMITKAALATAVVLADPLDLTISHSPLPDTNDGVGPYTVTAQVQSFVGSTVQAVDLHYSSDGGQNFVTVATTASGPDWVGDIPALGSPLTIQYYLTASDDQGNFDDLPKGVSGGTVSPLEFFVGTKTIFFADDFDTAGDNGWTHGGTGQDDWMHDVPNGSCGDPSSAYSGTKVWGNDLGPSGFNGCYANNVANWLRSPVIDCSQATSVALELKRWLQVEAGQFDQAEIYVNGTQVWVNPFGVDLLESSWTSFSVDISALAAGNPSVQVEFRLTSDGGVTFGGWNIDDFELVELGPATGVPPVTYCTGKVNSNACLPFISSVGSPSATSTAAFRIVGEDVMPDEFGILVYGVNGRSNLGFHNGTLCVKAPLTRVLPPKSSGNSAGGACAGELRRNFNNSIQSGNDPGLSVGRQVNAQWIYRDPGVDSFNDGLTNGIEFVINP